MDNLRLFLWLGLAAMLWLNYTAYMQDNGPPAAPSAVNSEAPSSDGGAAESPPALERGPSAPQTGPPPAGAPTAPALQPAGAAATPPVAPIHVHTDVLDVLIDTRGGDLVRADLPEYPVHKDQPNVPVRLLDYEPDDRWVVASGLRREDDAEEPDNEANYRASGTSFTLAPGQDELVVKLDWTYPGSVGASKVYTFHRGSYRVDLDMQLDNRGNEAWRVASYAQMFRVHNAVKRHIGSIDTYSFKGPVLYDGDRYEKLKVEDLDKKSVSGTYQGGWFAGIEHHFVAAVVPPPNENVRYEASASGNRWVLSALTPLITVAPGEHRDFPFTLFVGPKLQDQLEATADHLRLTVDYGVLTVLSRPLFLILSYVERVTGNWGWAIIIVTMLIKLVFYKLTETSGRSMAKMRRLQPRIKALQERHKDDRQAQSQAMMELYRKEKVNPAAGCLPMLIQMPFFFAFYWVLIESVEMRQAPFALWIGDLSARDPYFVLPLIMGAAMLLQARLNPPPPDPVQARIMQIMPLAFTAFFALFPSGLVLYYLTNTLLGILQQWRINKVVAREAERAS